MKAGQTPLRKKQVARSSNPRSRLRLRRERYRQMTVESAGAESAGTRAIARTLAEREQQIAKLTAEIATWRDVALRARADLDNARKRFQRESQETTQFANTGLIRELVPVADNLERALAAAPTVVDPKAVHDGVQMLMDQFLAVLQANGLQVIQPEGEIFNPHFHEAVAAEEREDIADNQILETLQKGYILRGRVVRPAMVRVGRLVQKAAAQGLPQAAGVTGMEETLGDFDESAQVKASEQVSCDTTEAEE